MDAETMRAVLFKIDKAMTDVAVGDGAQAIRGLNDAAELVRDALLPLQRI
jgi:hypothetical protein